MKWYNYIMARTVFKLIDEAEKRRRNREIQSIKDSEEKFDKGYLKYDFKTEEYIFVEPKKNEHFVTTEINDNDKVCNIILSKKPLSLESDKYDYPWDAERFCGCYAHSIRRMGYKVNVKRKAPILIADYDICCPYCFNSSPFENWVENSYKQELIEPPQNHKQLNTRIIKNENMKIGDVKTEKIWCPICNNGIENREMLIVKGDEWRVDFLKNASLPKYTSPLSEKIMKELKQRHLEEVAKSNLFDIISAADADRKVITNPIGIVTENAYGGLIAKVIEKVTLKNGYIFKTKWIKMKNNVPTNCELMKDISTSYAVSTDLKSMPNWIPKGDKDKFPIVYMPINELVIRNSEKKYDNEVLQEEIKKFHSGEALDFIKINSKKEVLNNYVLIQLALELGLSHVPVMIFGNYKEKQVLEKHYRNGILIKKQLEGNMVKALGTFIKKENNIFRTEAYIQWGNSDRILGSVLMLNPGSAKLQLKNYPNNVPTHGEIIIDSTMEALIKLVEELYEKVEDLEGRLYIYNLFPLQNPSSNDAINNFELLCKENEELVKSFPKERKTILDTFKKSPWILVGWGCGKSSDNLNFVKNEWLKLIKESGAPIIGKIGKDELSFYHPRPRIQSQQIEYRKEIKTQYDKIFKSRPNEKMEQLSTIADPSWKRHMSNYKPIEEFTIGRYRFLLYDIDEQEYVINYRYRLLCFIEESKEPILALNNEWTMQGTCYLGASVANGHINLGHTSPDTSLIEFRKWALQGIGDYIKDIDSKLLYEKIKKYDPIIYDREEKNGAVKIDELRKKRIEGITNNIREFEDRYEYCFIMDYEEKYSDFEVNAIPLLDIQVVLLEIDEKLELACIEFPKSNFNIEQIITWIQCENVYFGNREKANHTIERCGRLLKGIKFKGNVIAIYEKGNKSITLDINNYDEITETYNFEFNKIDTTKSKKLQNGLSIILNGQLVNEIPRIDFERDKDFLISNGNLIIADYIDDYCGGIGIYRHEDTSLPIVFFIDTNTTVYIDLYEKEDGSQVCIIEHKYILDKEVLY